MESTKNTTADEECLLFNRFIGDKAIVILPNKTSYSLSTSSHLTNKMSICNSLVNDVLEIRDNLQRSVRSRTDDSEGHRSGLKLIFRSIDDFIEAQPSSPDPTDPSATFWERLQEARIELQTILESQEDPQNDRSVERVITTIDRALKEYGISVLNPKPGAKADPFQHEIIATVESDQPEGHIVQVERSGFARGKELVCEPRVIVSDGQRSSERELSSIDDQKSVEQSKIRAPTGRNGDLADGSHERIPDVKQVASPPRRSISFEHFEFGERLWYDGTIETVEARLPTEENYDRVLVKRPFGVREVGSTTPEIRDLFLSFAESWAIVDDRERHGSEWECSEHVVGIIDVGDKLPWLAMEAIDGGSLKDRIEEHPDGFPLKQAIWMGECLCRAIEIAHDSGVVHHSLEPGIILFRETSGATWDVPKVADWGQKQSLMERYGQMQISSLHYSAPEQFDPGAFGDPDERTDIYQLGVIIYELLTGQTPWTGSPFEIMRSTLNDEPTAPSHRRPEIPTSLDQVILRALERSKSDRFQSVLSLKRALLDVRNEMRPKSDRNTGMDQEPQRGSVVREPPGSVSVRWVFDTQETITSSPTVVDDTLYIGSDIGVYALNAKTGELQWSFDVDGAIESPVSVAGGAIFVGSLDTHIYALDGESGDPLWQFKTESPVLSSPTVADGTVYFGSDDWNIYALDAETGEERWNFGTSGKVQSSPMIVGRTIYVGSNDWNVHALDARTGAQIWRCDANGRVNSLPIADSDTVYVGASGLNAGLHAIKLESGVHRWNYDTGSSLVTSPALARASIYFGSGDVLYALNAKNGTVQWRSTVSGRIESNPMVSNSTVYFGSLGGTVHALDVKSGVHRWRFDTGDDDVVFQSVDGNWVYIGCNDGKIYCVECPYAKTSNRTNI